MDALDAASMMQNGIFFLSADNGGIVAAGDEARQVGGGFNYPFRGQKATSWEGGARVNGFVYSPLLKKTGFEYRGLVHVSDWFP